MARYRKFDLRTWNDQKFRDLSPLPPSGQSLWIYLILGPQTTSIPGLFEASEVTLCDRLGWSVEAFRKAFLEASSMGMAKADWKARLVWLPNAPKYNKPESPNVVKSWGMIFDELPECSLKRQAYQSLKAFAEGWGEGYAEAFREAIREPSVKAMPNQEQEQEPKQKYTPKPPRSSAYADSLPDDFEQFWSAYPAKKAKPAAVKAWAKIHADQQMQAAILAGLERDRSSEQWTREGGRFIPHPATWLNQRRWEDEAAPQGMGAHGTNGAQTPWAGGI